MNTIDLSPIYRSSIGFDRLAAMLDSARQHSQSDDGYPPYNIEAVEENHYAITLAVAGFEESELDIEVEKGVLKISGRKAAERAKHSYLYQGIATRTFERKFQLADHVEIAGAALTHGLLTITLVKQIPEAMKARRITIGASSR